MTTRPPSVTSIEPLVTSPRYFNRRRFMQAGVLAGTAAAVGWVGQRIARVSTAMAALPPATGPSALTGVSPAAIRATTRPRSGDTFHRVRLTPIETYLGNPHQGCCTFQRFNGDELNPGEAWSEEGPLTFPAAKAATGVIDGYLPSTVAYCRWFWNVLEPAEGRYDFSMIEKSLEVCKQRGQTLAVRLMAFGWVNQPALPAWYQKKYAIRRRDAGDNQSIPIPDYDSPEYLDKWGGVIRQFGQRFDGHPLLESVDVAFLGPWGEGSGDCTPAQCQKFVNLHKEACPRTQRLALIEGEQMVLGLASGSGWRADCFGDLRAIGDENVPKALSFCHMYDAYPREVAIGGAAESWRTAPVFFETCHSPRYWHRMNYDIDFIIQQGFKYHTTYFMPKSTRLPEAWMEKLAGFCNRLGYRYILRQAQIDNQAPVNGAFQFRTWIENVGVAPIYRPYTLALRLRQTSRQAVIPLDDIDIRKWLPGDAWIDRPIQIPQGFERGMAELSVGLIDPQTQKPRIKFAVKEQFRDGWVDVGPLEIV